MWRRDFIGLLPASAALSAQTKRLTADEALKDLLEGNERFVTGKTLNPRRSPADFSKLASAQTPDAVIVGCADSRVPPEILFDQGVGDLFVIRVAGNVVSGVGPVVKGSIAYGVVALGAPLVIVLGHNQCGAVKAALETKELGLPEPVRDLVRMVNTGGEKDLDLAIVANVRAGVERLKSPESPIAHYVETKWIKVIGAVYNLASGKVGLVA